MSKYEKLVLGFIVLWLAWLLQTGVAWYIILHPEPKAPCPISLGNL